jgi:hypothetical protein
MVGFAAESPWEIAAANAASSDTYEDTVFVRTVRNGTVSCIDEVFVRFEDEGFHGYGVTPS